MKRLTFVVVLACSSVGFAERQFGDTIPKELVTLLLRGPGTSPGDSFEIKMGAPANFPRELLPKGVRAAASATSERAMTVVAEAPNLTSRDLAQHDRDLAAAGWTNSTSMGMRGLVSSTMSPSSTSCKGDQHATFSYSQRAAGGLNLRVSVTTDPRRGCMAMGGARPFFADVDLPNLIPPEGVRVMGSGSSSGNDRYDQHIRLETKLDPEALVKHYGDQLETQGWKRDARVAAAGVALARFTTVSTTKDTVVGIVTATAMPDGVQTAVSLQLLRIDPNRRFPGRIGGAGVR